MGEERARRHGWGTIRPARWEAVVAHRRGPVLDVGCSGGAYVRALCEAGVSATGLDLLSDPAWAGCRSSFVRGDGAALPFASRSFGTLLAFETLEHLPEPDQVAAEWHRVARERVILSVPQARSPYWAGTAGLDFHHHVDRTHVNLFDEDSLTSLLEGAGFELVELRPILPVHPFVPALDALGLPRRVVEGAGRRMRWLVRRQMHSGLLAVAARR